MNPKVLYIAPLLDFSGYAEVSRNYVKALDMQGMDIVTRDLRYDGGNYNRTDREKFLASKNLQDIDIIIQNTTPNETEYKPGAFNVNIFCWETDRIPQEWVVMLNQMDLIIVPIEQNRIAAQKSGVVKPIEVVPYSFDISKYTKNVKPFIVPEADNKFKFLSIMQFSKKKGLDPLLKAYLSEFEQNDNVILIIKMYINPNDGLDERNRIIAMVNAMKSILRLKSYPPIKLIHEIISHDDIERLYSTCDCYVLPSRGEGWGVPHFDALGWGLPAIATKGTGPENFINDSCGWLVSSHLSPVCDMPHPHDFMYTAKDNWMEPHVCDLKTCMRNAYTLWDSKNKYGFDMWDNKIQSAKQRVEDFSNEKIGAMLKERILKYFYKWKKA